MRSVAILKLETHERLFDICILSGKQKVLFRVISILEQEKGGVLVENSADQDGQTNATDCPDLSICMVAFNARDITLACIKSLIQWTKGIDYELFLVDNGSTDGTADSIRGEFPTVNLIVNNVNKGFPAANNQALSISKGRYCILLNNDMIFEQDALTQMVEYLDRNQDVGVLGCRLRYPDRRVQLTAHGDIRWQDHLFHALFLNRIFPKTRTFGHVDCTYLDLETDDLAVEVDWVAGAGLMVRRSYMQRVGLLDEKILFTGEDWEWCRRFFITGYRIVYYTGAQIIHYHGVSTIRYEGPEANKVRERSVMYMTATTHYVFRKLHTTRFIKIIFFSLAYRLHWLSRGIVHGLLYLIRSKSRRHNIGTIRGFFKGAFMTYKGLSQRFLAQDNGE